MKLYFFTTQGTPISFNEAWQDEHGDWHVSFDISRDEAIKTHKPKQPLFSLEIKTP
jgi:hypothetical protein